MPTPSGFIRFSGGQAHERGAGEGLGYNLNLPLERGTPDDAYLATLDLALRRIEAFGADVVVVALGGLMRLLTTRSRGVGRHDRRVWQDWGAAIAGLGVPCLFVQEGGYLCDELGENLTSVLNGYEASAA